MTNQENNSSFALSSEDNGHAACGVGMIVNFSKEGSFIASHELVQEGLNVLANFDYRSGYNLATEESDGSGIRFYGLPTKFFNKLLTKGEFEEVSTQPLQLEDKQYAVGQFFFSNHPDELNKAKELVRSESNKLGLNIIGWRNLANAMNLEGLSPNTLIKKPAIWQAIVLSNTKISEITTLTLNQKITYSARKKEINLHIVSLSTEKIIYKGMIRASLLGNVYSDFKDPDFTAHACDTHARFATNTSPQWSNAQPCPNFASHNGEFNSAFGNARQMSNELTHYQFKGIYPNEKLSDSMQFDADLANQVILKNISLDEAVLRLMAPDKESFPDEIKDMLKYWSLERIPYNGPAFMVASLGGYFIAKLDSMGLRPSRWALVEDKQGNQRLYTASDDLIHPAEHGIVNKGHLDPGGMLMLTPEGELIHTQEILERIANRYHGTTNNYFQQQLQKKLHSLEEIDTNQSDLNAPAGTDLQRILFASGWDYESEDQVVRYMAEKGHERTGAMGDDTNILYTHSMPPHISYFFHQLFAQVSAPPLDSIKERDRFSLTTFIGGIAHAGNNTLIELESPILSKKELNCIEQSSTITTRVIDTCFIIPDEIALNHQNAAELMSSALEKVVRAVEKIIDEEQATNLILSDRTLDSNRVSIPDLIAVAAVKRFLESKNLDFEVSIVIDSYQITGAHQAATLLALGAKAVYPRGAYAKIQTIFPDKIDNHCTNYKDALQKCLLKTMGKMGITDVNNYINGSLVGALGLDLSSNNPTSESQITLAKIFGPIYSPLRGVNLGHISFEVLSRHQHAYDPDQEFILLPRSGYYMPEKGGIKHGFGPEVINAFTLWMNEENIRAAQYQLHLILEKRGYPNYLPDSDSYTTKNGFLDPLSKNNKGFYPSENLEHFKPSAAFKKFTQTVENYHRENPTALHDYFLISANNENQNVPEKPVIQSQKEIRSLLFAGSMSQGALTVTDPKTPEKLGAHETLTRGMNAIGAKSASGEGGEAKHDLRDYLKTTRSKQFASGRFGISAEQILAAEEIEIKIAQGAKPGEGGELPGTKVSIRFAAQRGGLPHLSFISPPPHHDIYSIEDLEQLIYDIKSVNPKVNVAVKLVASPGIGTIAVGVAKAGANVINIASNSGGTGAAQQSSIKHAGFPAELGLAEVDRALRKTRLRELIKLRVSGSFKTAEEVLIAAILGADLFEFGSTAMLTLGCKMQRTCNLSCQPGVATDGHLFKGDQINTERYFVNLAAAIQERVIELGFNSLNELRSRTNLLRVNNPELRDRYDFSAILERDNMPQPLNEQEQAKIHAQLQELLVRAKEDDLINKIDSVFEPKGSNEFVSDLIELTTQDRSFGARIMGVISRKLQTNPEKKIIINTTGNAGQSFAFVNSLIIKHQGTVQDGCAKSMTGGELILCTPSNNNNYHAAQNTIAGNAMLYGASGGTIYVNGRAGHRFGILLKGAEVVVEGVGDFAFEYMTSGTGMILGKAGKGLGTGASGGIIFVYDPDNSLQPSNSIQVFLAKDSSVYKRAIITMLEKHRQKTNSTIANELLLNIKSEISSFKILIPSHMEEIKSCRGLLDIMQTYRLRNTPLTCGMKAWLNQKVLKIVYPTERELEELRGFIQDGHTQILSSEVKGELLRRYPKKPSDEQFDIQLPKSVKLKPVHQPIKLTNPVENRLKGIHGELDHLLLKPLRNIQAYVSGLIDDAQGCSGCRAQSCSGGEQVDSGCPSGKGINTINSLLKRIGQINEYQLLNKEQWNYLRQAFAVQIEESPFIAYTGAACPAPCQDACTETIPILSSTTRKKHGKPIGESVQVKDIEYDLYHIGRALGWFDGKKEWESEEIAVVFGGGMNNGLSAKQDYDEVMRNFQPPFRIQPHPKKNNNELIIIGSGPAAMQIAYKALLDGIQVRMYEQSDKPGGLLADGIPAHKFDKIYLREDFSYLKAMGMELHLESKVVYNQNSGDYCVKVNNKYKIIANSANENQFVALCTGAGQPKQLPPSITSELPVSAHQKLVQATDFLKATNDIAHKLANTPFEKDIKERLIEKHLNHIDPRNKKIVVIGGGDTAQDVIRWVARYFNQGEEHRGKLHILVRGPQQTKRGIFDSYPAPSRAPTRENALKKAEIEYIQATETFLVEPVSVLANPENGTLTLKIKESKYKYAEQVINNADLKLLLESLPRESRSIEKSTFREIEHIDLIICALGFSTDHSFPSHVTNLYRAGDVTGTGIIVAAQNSANKVYGLIKTAMKNNDSKPINSFRFFADNSSKSNQKPVPGEVTPSDAKDTILSPLHPLPFSHSPTSRGLTQRSRDQDPEQDSWIFGSSRGTSEGTQIS